MDVPTYDLGFCTGESILINIQFSKTRLAILIPFIS